LIIVALDRDWVNANVINLGVDIEVYCRSWNLVVRPYLGVVAAIVSEFTNPICVNRRPFSASIKNGPSPLLKITEVYA